MPAHIDPYTGDLITTGGGVAVGNLSAEQRNLAVFRDADAQSILSAMNADQEYFTAYGLQTMRAKLDDLVAAGILTKHQSAKHDGSYYKPTSITRNWCHTANALRQERCRLLQERSG